jgi:hypothetical protein
MQRREYDQARGLWYYYDHNISTYVYDNGLRIPGATLATRYVHGLYDTDSYRQRLKLTDS